MTVNILSKNTLPHNVTVLLKGKYQKKQKTSITREEKGGIGFLGNLLVMVSISRQ